MTRLLPFALALLVLTGIVAALALGVTAWIDSLPGAHVGLVLASAVVASTRSVLVLRPFTEGDWCCWAGATRAPDGRAPMIGDRDGLTLIADACGVEVTFYRDLPDEDATWAEQDVYRYELAGQDAKFGDLNRAYGMAVFVASSLPATMTPDYLLGLGFARVG